MKIIIIWFVTMRMKYRKKLVPLLILALVSTFLYLQHQLGWFVPNQPEATRVVEGANP
jgi:hypothetical protein